MKKTKNMPKEKLIITKKQIVDDLWRKMQSSDNPAISAINRKSLTTIYKMLENTLMCYLADTDLSYEDMTVEIRPFKGLVIRRFIEPAETKINNLTGKEYTKRERTRFCAYIPQYWSRNWNELDD